MVTKNIPASIQKDIDIGSPPEELFIEQSVSGYEKFMSGFDRYEITNTLEVPYSHIDKMIRNDGQASALYNILTLPIKAFLTRYVDVIPAKGGTSGKEASFIEGALFNRYREGGMITSYSNIISSLCMAMVHGFRVHEKVWRLHKGYIVPYKIAQRNPETVFLKSNINGEFDGFNQRTNYLNQYINVKIPKEKSLLFTVGGERNPIYGVPVFLPAYYHYDKKHKIYYIAHMSYQFNAVPGRIGKVPKGTSVVKRKAWLDALSSLGINSTVVPPDDGYDVDQFPKTISRIANFRDMIDHHNIMMTKSVLAHFIDLGIEGGSGSWALSKNDFDLYFIALTAFVDSILDVYNDQIIPQLIDWNFGTGKYPTLKFVKPNDDMINLVRDVFYRIATDDSPNSSPEFMYELEKQMSKVLGLPLEYNKEEMKVEFDKNNFSSSYNSQNDSDKSKEDRTLERNVSKTRNRSGAKQPENQNVPLEELDVKEIKREIIVLGETVRRMAKNITKLTNVK